MRVALIACSKSKCPCRAAHPAQTLYISLLFRLSLQWAVRRQLDRIFILSAKYGLLEPKRYVFPYDKSLVNMAVQERRRWARRVSKVLRAVIPEGSELFFLAGEKYRWDLQDILKDQYIFTVPMLGMGLGKQIQWLQRELYR